MKIFLAGATGALGRQLLPRLVERGHEVTGMTRRESKQQLIRDGDHGFRMNTLNGRMIHPLISAQQVYRLSG